MSLLGVKMRFINILFSNEEGKMLFACIDHHHGTFQLIPNCFLNGIQEKINTFPFLYFHKWKNIFFSKFMSNQLAWAIIRHNKLMLLLDIILKVMLKLCINTKLNTSVHTSISIITTCMWLINPKLANLIDPFNDLNFFIFYFFIQLQSLDHKIFPRLFAKQMLNIS